MNSVVIFYIMLSFCLKTPIYSETDFIKKSRVQNQIAIVNNKVVQDMKKEDLTFQQSEYDQLYWLGNEKLVRKTVFETSFFLCLPVINFKKIKFFMKTKKPLLKTDESSLVKLNHHFKIQKGKNNSF